MTRSLPYQPRRDKPTSASVSATPHELSLDARVQRRAGEHSRSSSHSTSHRVTVNLPKQITRENGGVGGVNARRGSERRSAADCPSPALRPRRHRPRHGARPPTPPRLASLPVSAFLGAPLNPSLVRMASESRYRYRNKSARRTRWVQRRAKRERGLGTIITVPRYSLDILLEDGTHLSTSMPFAPERADHAHPSHPSAFRTRTRSNRTSFRTR